MFWFLLALKTGREERVAFRMAGPQLSTQFDRLDRVRHFTSTMIAVQPLTSSFYSFLSVEREKISLSLGTKCNQLCFILPSQTRMSRFRVPLMFG